MKRHYLLSQSRAPGTINNPKVKPLNTWLPLSSKVRLGNTRYSLSPLNFMCCRTGAFMLATCLAIFLTETPAVGDSLLTVDVIVDQLYTVNTQSGITSTVGSSLGPSNIAGIAYDSVSETLYGVEGNGVQLVTIDIGTGTVTPTGGLSSLNFYGVDSLAIHPQTNVFYAIDTHADELITINPATGVGTSVGSLGIISNVQGIAFDPNTAALYAVDADSDSLLSINTATGQGAVIGSLGFFNVTGLAFDTMSGTMFGVDDSSNSLISVNTSTGAGTYVADLGIGTPGALTFIPVPEPSAIIICSLAGTAALLQRRRRS